MQRQSNSVSIYFHPDAFTTSGPRLMGRNVAGTSFFKGLLRHSKCDHLTALLPKESYRETLEDLARGGKYEHQIRTVSLEQMSELSGSGPIFFPGPNIGQHAWHRRFFGDRAWSLCGVTHTLSSAGAMDAIADLLIAPIYTWDALICTSTAARSVIRNILERQADYLADRLGARVVHRPMLPVIPLGVDQEEFNHRESSCKGARERLQIDHDETAVLFVGRLSFHAKAHPMAIYQALEIVAKESGKKLILIEAGIHANDYIRDAFAEAANECAPSIRIIRIDGKSHEAMNLGWCAADIFCSLSDNIQETFGITPIEAMASGLPVIASDWNGYRDTVVHGETGFLISTTQPPPEVNLDLAIRHALEIDTYDMYCGHTSMQVSIAIDEVVIALKSLLNPDLRRSMGDAGRTRVKEFYDWKQIIPKYEEIWAQLNEELSWAPDLVQQDRWTKSTTNHWPARPDPFSGFSKFATKSYSDNTRLKRGSASWTRIKHLSMVKYVPHLLSDSSISEALCTLIEGLSDEDTVSIAELLQRWPANSRAKVFRILTIFVKLDVARIVRPI